MRLDSNGNFLGWDDDDNDDDDHEGFNISDISCGGKEIDLNWMNEIFSQKNDKIMRVTLFGDRVLILPDEKTKTTSGGIVIPDSVNPNENKRGTVIKHGDGAYDDLTGVFIPITVKEGDRVIYAVDAQIMQSEDWDNLLLMKESDILTII